MDIDQIKEMMGSDTYEVGGEKFNINKTNVAKYAANKRISQRAVLANFQKSRGIAVKKTKGEVKK